MHKKIWMCLLALVMLLGNGAAAQGRKQHPRKQVKPELRKELMAYRQQNILPFLKEQRQNLDKKLSKADRKEINEIRQQLAQHRQGQMEQVRLLKEERKTPKTPLTEEQKTAFKEARAKHKEQMARLGEIAKRNEKHLSAIGEKVKPQQEKWAADLKAIAAKHGVDAKELKDRRHHRRGGHQEKHLTHWNALRFLLMDPNRPESFFGPTTPSKKQKPEEQNTAVLQLSPNPVTDKATLTFTIAKEGNVRIELVDAQGKMVEQVVDRLFSPGTHQQAVQLNQLRSGVYFYRITSLAGTETLRFLKQ